MAIAAFFIVLGLVLIAVHVLLKYWRVLLLADRFPGPKAIPILGNVLLFIGKTQCEFNDFAIECREKYGRVCRFWAFNFVEFMVTDPNVMEIVMSNSTKYMRKSRVYSLMRPWLGDGLLLSSGTKWHKRRKIITPAFHFAILEQFADIFDRNGHILVSRLSPLSDGHVVDIYSLISQLALDIVCETAMGIRINAQDDSESEYVKALDGIKEVISYRLANFWQQNDILFNLTGGEWKRKSVNYLRVLHNYSDSIILKRREEIMRNLNTSHELSERKRMALLDILLQSTIDGQPLSNHDIREEVDTFMFEAHDSTTNGIAFTLFTISRHIDVQDKLFAEIRSVCGDKKDTPISYRQLHELKYIDPVIKETLRLYPPVPAIGRCVDVDIHLDDGLIIPKGSMLNISLFLMFRDPEYFPDPMKFNPNRFINGTLKDENVTKFSSFAYIPFSAGPRNCIGQKYAMLEMKCIISNVLRHFELLPMGDEPDTCCEIIMRTKNGIQMGLKPRIYD